MPHLKSFCSILISSILLASCGSGNSKTGLSEDMSLTAAESSSASTSNASFYCKLDGANFSESRCTGNINAAFHLTGENKGQIFFMLADIDDPSQKLNFQIAGKTGSTTIRNSPPHFSYEGLVLKGFVTYIDDPVIVNIISISPSRVSGTFSGTYTLQKGTGSSHAKQTIQVTEGKFDIPFSTDVSWKKMYQAE